MATVSKTDYRKIITIEAGKWSGKPCVRGLRVTVFDVLDHLAAGMTNEQILKEFPYLTEEDIRCARIVRTDKSNLPANRTPKFRSCGGIVSPCPPRGGTYGCKSGPSSRELAVRIQLR